MPSIVLIKGTRKDSSTVNFISFVIIFFSLIYFFCETEGKTERTFSGLDWVDPTGRFPTWVLERKLREEDWLTSKPLEIAASEAINDELDWSDLDDE